MSHKTDTGEPGHSRAEHQTGRRAAREGAGPRHGSSVARLFDHFASSVARATGSPIAFGCAVLIIVLWAVAGPWAGFSEVWQLVVNTGTTIITFLMVFLIQQNQNKDSRALHVKLDELLMALKGASDKLVDIEDLEEDELNEIAEKYRRLATAARKRASSE
ncbi:low affinity iron permease family protein [Bordetella petrii]|uniref:low affinity iron permease family protein n=1 Tax=Bordetella petrii TaxID=94624 RepID=UPI001A96322C|nr:low affinity iron permease family protein [Bordetella petrii]MBO1111010.1 low affinity iron permease family protein [Bordetella petrii]